MCEEWPLMWIQVSPKEERDCNTMSIPDLLFEQLTPKLFCGSWMVKTTLSPGLVWFIDVLLPYHIPSFYVPAIPLEEHCCLAHRLPTEHLKDIVSITDVLCVIERWRDVWLVQQRLPKHCSAWSREGLWLRIWNYRWQDGYWATDDLLFELASS